MTESKYWWVFVDEWGNVEYQYGTLLEAVEKHASSCIVSVTKAEWKEDK